jgi:hypothetical protein
MNDGFVSRATAADHPDIGYRRQINPEGSAQDTHKPAAAECDCPLPCHRHRKLIRKKYKTREKRIL